MNEDHFFSKLCWVCLAEENDMSSLLSEDVKIQIDSNHAPVSLCDLLTYIVQSEIFYIGGPHLICNNCKIQACAAYKFKKRCEISSKILKKCKLEVCRKEDYPIRTIDASNSIVAQAVNEDIEIFNLENNIDNVNEDEDETCLLFDKIELESVKDDETEQRHEGESSENKDAIYLIVDGRNHQAISSTSDISYLPDPIAENARLPNPSPKKFLCSVCGLQKSRNSIRQHMLRHANLKNHTCPYCQKKFNDKGNLKVHVRIHTGVHPYVCDICGKKFIQASGLKTHKRMHDNVKPYKCHICTYSTRTSSHLQLHIKRHIGVKNYHCEQCDYSACSKAELKYHLAKHSNDKCHICKTCGKGFTRYKGLKTHEKSHTGEKPHICELCGRGFTQAHSLRSHLRNIHKQIN
ncbi:hypothetical protein ILUMI_01011 [Ignelater luminosus]|uniref:C2H2-type domain-containing protein n=1 Tax=Ignelater luminosus TaxID=2038154 RepID=A0A8K0DF60_IGNLU|nr:hypothetical protein ILUMI_01011 [Ignelater luminosus]